MNINDQIKQLEKERDELLKNTPLKTIKAKDPTNPKSKEITTHSRIKRSYHNKIMNLKTWNNPEIRKKRLKGLKDSWTIERKNKTKRIADPDIQLKIKQTLKDKYNVDNISQIESVKNKKKETSLNHYNVENPAHSDSVQNKIKQTSLNRYGFDRPQKADEIKSKTKQTILNKYGKHPSQLESHIELARNIALDPNIKAKRYNTMKQNNTFHTSKPEDKIYDILNNIFIHLGGVERQYKSNLYPFNCDFYIPSLDLYIECHFTWLHGDHPFDPNNTEDQLTLEKWKSKNTKYYDNAVYTWTNLDVRKLKIFKENNLNYKIFYTQNELYEWLQDLI